MAESTLKEQHLQQQEILAFLKNAPHLWDTQSSEPEDIERIETHGATVLLGKYYALKLKKAVYFDHMDYSTSEKRRLFCEKELTLNRKTAPALYLDTLPIYVNLDESFSFDAGDHVADHLLKMRRFPKGNRLDEYIDREDLSLELQEKLADAVISLHTTAKIVASEKVVPDFCDVIHKNFQQLDGFCPHILDLKDVQDYRQRLNSFVKDQNNLLTSRITDQWVRWGHGDLHLQNICLLEGEPLLFDAIEYQDDFVISDVLYDLSFLIMDLWERNLKAAANSIFNRYLTGMNCMLKPQGLQGLQLLPFYLSMRAGIRTHVAGNRYLQSHDEEDKDAFEAQTRHLFGSSQSYLSPSPAQMIAIGGFSGSGKSTLARHLAPFIGATPGAVRIRSDEIRRQLIGWDEFSKMPQSAYTSEQSAAVYKQMAICAKAVLQTGHSVILDAVLDRECDQLSFEQVAKDLQIPFTGIWLNVDRQTMEKRIDGRSRDASDATIQVLQQQILRNTKTNSTWQQVDGSGTAEQSLDHTLQLLEQNKL
ncbi:MAG: AAA family ATPase [Sneathiella sp.]|nr:AAA family ATPase [Sneathiella sp.]